MYNNNNYIICKKSRHYNRIISTAKQCKHSSDGEHSQQTDHGNVL